VLADAAQPLFGLSDEILVAELEVALARLLTALPRREALRPPTRCELGDGSRLGPRLAREALRQLEERERRVAPVADEMYPDRVRKEPLEQRQLLHVERRLVAPTRLALAVRVRLEDRGDRLAGRHLLAEARPDVVRTDPPVVQRPQALQAVEERAEPG